jgi:predicted nucleic acid-binding protein
MSETKIKNVNVFSLCGKGVIKGIVKNGLDSSILINLIACHNVDEFKKREFPFQPNLVYIQEVSRTETIGVLIHKFKYTLQEAKDAFENLKREFQIETIKRNITDIQYENIVTSANETVVNKHLNEKLKIGEKDVIIIGGFLKEKINFIHSADQAFCLTCDELKLNVIPLPKRDIEKENEIKKLLKRK